eukprot:CAMPEP_0185615654 /NCGR_PEP_ID=MMETSP0436-20130131/36773_1 /TAXON_ID=626734 ORGANISM="Favella taraikaensis, Strain Fe Narragansett Bay" /NCGR_SAMPLE_ID=MMETSP0436 /ASSEMBLY_ACC=CAM_ASM_000390 /LENGTH=80 /DNA_ID=CAMNT_0028251643 /DNA_START=404 /DNA_END=649 /DNA_ORIENTATION=+
MQEAENSHRSSFLPSVIGGAHAKSTESGAQSNLTQDAAQITRDETHVTGGEDSSVLPPPISTSFLDSQGMQGPFVEMPFN